MTEINSTRPEKHIVLLSMLYMTFFFASITVGYKIVAFGHSLFCASILIFPLLFPFSDALTEIYGTKIAKSMIWYTIICEIIFVFLTNAAIRLPSPPNWSHQAEYNFLTGSYLHILLANASALLISFYMNVILIDKWRILFKGKYYFFRSLGATAIGEIIYTLITNVIAYAGVLSWLEIANIVVSDYFLKMMYSAIIAYPAALAVTYTRMKYSANQATSFKIFQERPIKKIIDLSEYAKKKSWHFLP